MNNSGAITSSMQDYLETMLLLSESMSEIRVTDIASKLNIAKSSVAQAIDHLKKHGLVRQERYGTVELTDSGKDIAIEVRWRHRKLKQFLIDVLEVDPKIAEKEACLMEHVVSSHTMTRLMRFLETSESLRNLKKTEPCRDIVNSESRGKQDDKENNGMEVKLVRTLNDLKAGEHGKVLRIISNKLLKSRLLDMGITPGADVQVKGLAPMGDPVEVKIKGYHLTLRKDEASQIFVEIGA